MKTSLFVLLILSDGAQCMQGDPAHTADFDVVRLSNWPTDHHRHRIRASYNHRAGGGTAIAFVYIFRPRYWHRMNEQFSHAGTHARAHAHTLGRHIPVFIC